MMAHEVGPPTATLLVKHLPEGMTEEMLGRLFSHYGASSLRPCAGGRLRNCAFVDFKNEAAANHALFQLNRLNFLGKVLSVERANHLPSLAPSSQQPMAPPDASASASKPTSIKQHKPTAESDPIAPTLGVDYPFPPHLQYQYPPPDSNILTNILNALIAVPRFYTQVLHLMNKMNIPPPFRMALPTPPLPPVAAPPPPPPLPPQKPPTPELSTDESEIESSDEDDQGHRRKKVKREVIVGPAVDKTVAHESVGLKPVTVPKELTVIKKKTPVLQIKIASKPVRQGTVEESRDPKERDGSADIKEMEMMAEKRFATTQEIESGKMPPEEILSLPMFKNYTPGNPAAVLYLKNLAKDVVSEDFYFIFGSLFGTYEAARSGLSIKLMQEGRMRGQSFVTFPSIELAERALSLVNGFVFKGKPIIIQFGRSSSTNKDS